MDHNNTNDIDWEKVLNKLDQEQNAADAEIYLNPEEQLLYMELLDIKAAGKTYTDFQSFNTEERLKELHRHIQPTRRLIDFKRFKYAAAAMLLFCLSIGVLLYLQVDKQIHKTALYPQIKPGGNKAYLTLADGRRIVLTDAANGEIARQSGIRITKTADGQVVYEIGEAQKLVKGAAIYNTIETPKGGQYQLKLPDGTKVWLNAASSLRFPTSFTALKERKVQLNGEAYFEVAKDKNKTFLVSTGNQMIEVLGTHFNVNSYSDNVGTRTTLLEGSVKVTSNKDISKILKPGQEANATDKIVVSEVDVEEAVAWKNGYFNFDDERLETIMKEIARWYDVDVVYQNDALKTELFGAVTTRFADVTMLLRMLEETGSVKFTIKGKQIIISKK